MTSKEFSLKIENIVKEKKISQYSTKAVTQMSSSGAYRTGINNFRSYQDDDVGGNHRKKIVSLALQNFLAKSPLEITVRAREFLTGDQNYTIGKTIRVIFLLQLHQKISFSVTNTPISLLAKSAKKLLLPSSFSEIRSLTLSTLPVCA